MQPSNSGKKSQTNINSIMIIVKNFLSAVVGVSCTFMLVNTMIINKESKAMQGYSTLVYNRPFFFFSYTRRSPRRVLLLLKKYSYIIKFGPERLRSFASLFNKSEILFFVPLLLVESIFMVFVLDVFFLPPS